MSYLGYLGAAYPDLIVEHWQWLKQLPANVACKIAHSNTAKVLDASGEAASGIGSSTCSPTNRLSSLTAWSAFST
ncbi:MAG: hypothetical protein VX990_01685 [Pseudomonadota bacterium]|nr:hypothetical protein [Pseudomonadota bacterium]